MIILENNVIPSKVNIHIPNNPATPLFHTHPQRNWFGWTTKRVTRMFISVLFVITKIKKRRKRTLMSSGKKMYKYTVSYLHREYRTKNENFTKENHMDEAQTQKC